MAEIAAVGGAFAGDTSAATVLPAASRTTATPEVSQFSADSPATIVVITSPNQCVKAQSLPDANPDDVSRTLCAIGGVNGFAWAYNTMDWAGLEKKVGPAIVEEQKRTLLLAMGGSAGMAYTGLADNPVIPVHGLPSPEAIKAGDTFITATVNDFSFTHGGSTYTVTHLPNGLINGTKNGHWWKTWQVTFPTSPAAAADADANAALQTLTVLTSNQGQLSKRVGIRA